ncbi:MAG: AarF/ABC1/UbiB kinase family protein [Gemmatimonadetes bacterium]|nr:AarF/ABC1/UbiB kinase family protein [Gemmatimonadota bacterium]
MTARAHLSRYLQLLQLAVRHGRRDLLEHAQATDLLSGDLPQEPATPAETARAEALAHELERMGPTFIKFGQLLSTRADLLPPAYLEALERLQDKVAPFPFAQVRAIIERELGRPLHEAYQSFDEVPVAAASLGQVHRAVLPSGEPVAVKVLRPGIRERVRGDIAAMQSLLRVAQRVSETAYRFDLLATVDEFRRVVGRELDYRAEAVHLERLRTNLTAFPNLIVPRPIASHTRSRVLTMQWMEGRKVTELTPAELAQVRGHALAQELFRAYLQQILVDGFYHADPHPGNVLVTPDGRLALLDLGMVAAVPEEFRDALLRLLVALAEGKGDAVADVSIETGERTELFEERRFRRLMRDVVANYSATPAASVKGGRLFFVLGRAAAEAGLRMPPEFALFGKTLMNLEHVGMTLDPQFDPNDAVQRYANDVFGERLRQGFTPRAVLQGVVDVERLRQQLPMRLQRLLDQSDDGIPVRLRLAETDRFIRAIDRIANRITVGLLVAALIVSGTMWVNYQNFTLWGFPGMVVIGYALAAGGALVLIRNVMTSND